MTLISKSSSKRHWNASNVQYLLMIVVLISCCPALAIADEDYVPTSYAQRLVDRIFQSGAISFYFDDEIEDIAENFVAGTKFAGNVLVNKPQRPGTLAIYVLKYNEQLPSFTKNNCNAFTRDDIIICDSNLLDSIPNSLPIVATETDRVEPPFLMQWLLGHEIGHVLFRHQPSNFLKADVTATENTKKIAAIEEPDFKDRLLDSNPAEITADRFAIMGLPIRSKSAWLQFGPQLLDAIYWELSNRPFEEKEMLPDANLHKSNEAVSLKKIYKVKIRHADYPPMLIRLSNLLDQIYATYPDFNLWNPVKEPGVELDVQYISGLKNDTTEGNNSDNLFFGSYYVGHHGYKRKMDEIAERNIGVKPTDFKNMVFF